MIEFKNVSKNYGKTKALKECSWMGMDHEIIGVCGQNGSGKTTLFRLLLGLLQPDSGEIRISGEIRSSKHHSMFGYMPEQRSLLSDLKVNEQLHYFGKLKGMEHSTIQSQIDRLADELEIRPALYNSIGSLSKGNQQKIQLMAALIHDPHYIILDEPLTGLDYANVKLFQDQFTKLSKAGKTILLSSHQYDYMDDFCTSLIVLKKGEMVLSGNLDQLKDLSGKCCITVNSDSCWMDHVKEGDIVEECGNKIKITLENRTQAKRLLNTLSKDNGIKELEMNRIGIKELIRGANG